jgi:hypothetical protein
MKTGPSVTGNHDGVEVGRVGLSAIDKVGAAAAPKVVGWLGVGMLAHAASRAAASNARLKRLVREFMGSSLHVQLQTRFSCEAPQHT